jgi:hypothetical protein
MFRTLLAAAAFLGSAVMAQAATVSYVQTFSGPATLTFAGFDAGLGTLTGVSATFDITATIDDGGLNARNGATRYRGNVNGAVSITGLPQLSNTFALTGPLATCASNSNLNNNCRASFDDATRSILFTPTVSDLTKFSSAFDAIIGFSTSVATSTGSYRGNVNRDWTGTGTVTLTYTYAPAPSVVPLPAGAPLLLGGLAIFGALGIRRRRV